MEQIGLAAATGPLLLKAHSHCVRQRTLTSGKGRTSTSVGVRRRTSPHIDGYTYNICKCYMLMIFSVNIYVIIYVTKMSDDEAVDIAVAVANASRIYFWGNC